MKDERKTKKQLVSELLELRQRIAKFEQAGSERLRVEETLKQAEQEKEAILDSLVEHVVHHDMDMKVLWANRAACESVGLPCEELIGRQCYEIWAKRSDPCEDCPVEKARETGQPQALEKTTPDGRSWFIQGSPVRDNNGDIVGMVELALEISEHKRAEEALRASEERFRTVADFTYDWEYWVAPNGDFVYVSPSSEQITGYCPDEFQKDPRIVEMMAHPDDRSLVKRHLTEEFESQEATSIDFRIITQSGEERWIGHICQPVYSTDGRWLGRRASNRDITQEKRIEKALRETHDELERRVQERTAELVKANEQLEQKIEERTRAEEELGRYKLIVSAVHDPMSFIDSNYIYRTVNDAYTEIFKRPREEIVGNSVADIFGTEIFDKQIKGHLDRCLTGEEVHYSDWLDFPDGKQRCMRISYYPFFENDKSVSGVVVNAHDMTDLELAEEALQRVNHERAVLLSTVPAMIFWIDKEGKFIRVNDPFAAALNKSADDIKGKSLFDLYPEDMAGKYYEDNVKVMESGVPKTHIEEAVETPNGMMWVSTDKVPYRDEKGDMIGIIGFSIDITKRKQAEEALRESEERFRRAFENANVGMCLVDTEGRLTKVNSQMSEMFGYSQKELEAMTVNDITHPEYVDISPKFIRRASSGEITHAEFEKQYFHKKGHLVWGQISSSVVRDVKGKTLYFISHVKDITELKKAEEERLTYQLQLQSLASELVLTEQRERRRLATDLHDSIGQLLAISKIKLSALGNVASAGDIAGDLKEIRDLIAQVIEQTRSLVFELSPPVLYEFGIEAALEYLVERMQKLHDIRFEFVDDRQPKPLSEDLSVLPFRAVQELLVNVVKHARARNARTFIETKDEKIRITVEDDGVGFDISEIDSHIGRAGKFGLFSIRERLNHLGGHFDIASKPGHGTQVSLAAPLQKD